jgi:Peptidase inhibitor family I36
MEDFMRFTIALAAAGLLLTQTLRPLPAAAEGPIGTTGGPNIQFQGCMYYEHINFGGKQGSIPGGIRRKLGSAWDDEISSIACNSYCKVTVFEHRDFNGASHTFAGNISFVGDGWNDDISSMVASCSR